jgi:hypothetical protein
MIANWGAHLNDIALWGMNAERTGPVEIDGTGTFPPKENLWNIVLEFEVNYQFANGMKLTCKTGKPAVRFEGTQGWIQVNDSGPMDASSKSLLSWKPGPADLALTYKTSEKRDFLDAVKSRGETLLDAEKGHRNTSLCHLGMAAIACGRKIKWDPTTEQVVGDAEAAKLLEPQPYRAPWKL